MNDMWYALTADDHRMIKKYLSDNGYDSIIDWAVDSDYVFTSAGWLDLLGNTVDLHMQLLFAIQEDK